LPGTDAERPNWRRKLGPDIADFFTIQRTVAILAGVDKRRP
jgi:4-alpha-glucanotransferase